MTAAAVGTLRLGTRSSALATVQSRWVAEALHRATGDRVELVEVSTAGDRSARPISELGNTGVFVSALRDALLSGEIDVAVHSYKDLPTAAPDGLELAAVPPRADPRDALVARDGLRFAQLPPDARVGTGAPRRLAQLRAARPDLRYVPVRGNVDTRAAMVADGTLDAVVLAAAGLERLGRTDLVTDIFHPMVLTPAPAQGALAVEARSGEKILRNRLANLDDGETRTSTAAERAVLAGLGAGCTAPIGALATRHPGVAGLELHAVVAALTGDRAIRRACRIDEGAGTQDATQLGNDLARELVAAGASEILGSSR